MSIIAKLAVAVQADTKGFEKGMKRTRDEAQKLGSITKGLVLGAAFTVGTAAATGYWLAIQKTSDEVDKLAKNSAKLGMTVAELQRIQFAAEQSGIAAEQVGTIMQRLTRRSSSAAFDGSSIGSALKELNLDAEKFDRLGAEEKLIALSRSFGELDKQSDKVRLAFALFDTEGVGMVNMLDAGEEGIRDMLTTMNTIGTVSQEQARAVEYTNDRWNELGHTFTSLRQQIGLFGSETRGFLYEAAADVINFYAGITPKPIESVNDAALENARIGDKLAKSQADLNARREQTNKLLALEANRLESVNAQADNLAKSLSHQRDTFGMDSMDAQIRGLQTQGADQSILDDLRYHADKIRELEKIAKLEDEQQRRRQEMTDRVKELGKAEVSSAEKYKAQILELIAAGKSGILTQDEFNRGIRRTQQEFLQSQNSRQQTSQANIGSLIANERGSLNAFQSIDRHANRQEDQNLKAAQASVQVLKSIDANIKQQLRTGQIKVEAVSLN